jgi:hypothetical protein
LCIFAAAGCDGRASPTEVQPTLPEAIVQPEAQALRATSTLIEAPAASSTPQPLASTSTPMPTQATATVSPVPSPTVSPSPSPTVTPSPLPSPTPSPSPTPAPVLTRLTSGECCTQPFWSPDSQAVLFIDKPNADAPTGIWGVPITQPGATPQLFTERIAAYTDDLMMVIGYGGSETTIEQLDGPLSDTVVERWTVPARGRPVAISPGGTQIAWSVSNGDVPVERRVTEIWVANLDGSDARSVVRLSRGGFGGWISDEVLLLTGRESLDSRVTVAYTYSLIDGSTVELMRSERSRGYAMSPDRRWMVVFVTFSENPADNGLWLVRTDGTEKRQLGQDLFGDFAWRDKDRLLIIPFKPNADYHEFWQYDVETGQVSRLTDPEVTPLKIANGDWQVSPDGRSVAYVESSDKNIWLLTLVD